MKVGTKRVLFLTAALVLAVALIGGGVAVAANPQWFSFSAADGDFVLMRQDAKSTYTVTLPAANSVQEAVRMPAVYDAATGAVALPTENRRLTYQLTERNGGRLSDVYVDADGTTYNYSAETGRLEFLQAQVDSAALNADITESAVKDFAFAYLNTVFPNAAAYSLCDYQCFHEQTGGSGLRNGWSLSFGVPIGGCFSSEQVVMVLDGKGQLQSVNFPRTTHFADMGDAEKAALAQKLPSDTQLHAAAVAAIQSSHGSADGEIAVHGYTLQQAESGGYQLSVAVTLTNPQGFSSMESFSYPLI